MAESTNYPSSFKGDMMSGPSTSLNSTVWRQVPPTNMSWGTAYGNFPQVVRFAGSDCNSTFPFGSPIERTRLDSDNKTKTWFAKRKGFFENEMVPPPKQHITEEHMASQLQSMHISNMYTSHSSVENCNAYNETCRLPEVCEESSSDCSNNFGESSNRLPSLVVCDELRQLQTPNILPPSLVAKLESPSKALVLWKPPTPILQSTSFGRNKNSRKRIGLLDVSNNNNNNDELEAESEDNHRIDESSSSLYIHMNDFSPCTLISGDASRTDAFCNSSDVFEDMSVDI